MTVRPTPDDGLRYRQSLWVFFLFGGPALAGGLYALSGPLWMSHADLSSRGGPAMLVIVGLVFVASAAATTCIPRTVEIALDARVVRTWHGLVVRCFERTHPLEIFETVAVRARIRLSSTKSGGAVYAGRTYDVVLRGQGEPLMLTTYRTRQRADDEAANLAVALQLGA